MAELIRIKNGLYKPVPIHRNNDVNSYLKFLNRLKFI